MSSDHDTDVKNKLLQKQYVVNEIEVSIKYVWKRLGILHFQYKVVCVLLQKTLVLSLRSRLISAYVIYRHRLLSICVADPWIPISQMPEC